MDMIEGLPEGLPEGFAWQQPPAVTGRRRVVGESRSWKPVAELLRRHPRRWARVTVYPSAQQAGFLAGYLRRHHGLEARAIGGEVYARWIGGGGRRYSVKRGHNDGRGESSRKKERWTGARDRYGNPVR